MNDLSRDFMLIKAHCLGKSLAWAYAHADVEPNEDEARRISGLQKRRAKGEPMEYLLEFAQFYDVQLRITPDVLCPRPETELLVDWAVANLATSAKVLELGTGSGAIALALGKARPDLSITATDVSDRALLCAEENTLRLGVSLNLVSANWCRGIKGRFDAILSNPPYVAADDPCLKNAPLSFEPRLALDGGVQGLESLREIIHQAPCCLREGGVLSLEHGYDQARSVQDMMREAGFRGVETLRDLSGHERVSVGHHSTNAKQKTPPQATQSGDAARHRWKEQERRYECGQRITLPQGESFPLLHLR